jgi:hypothetical protein
MAKIYACEESESIQTAMALMAANRLQCCFSKSGLAGKGIRCWCYRRDDDGKEMTLPCTNRRLVVNESAIGDARFGFSDETG